MIVTGAAAWVLTTGAAEPTTMPATAPASRPSSQPSSQPAKELTLDLGNKATLKLVLIPAGKFTMGSPHGEEGRSKEEGPQREVTITQPFYMGVYEVTQEQYEAVLGQNPSHFKGAQNPVDTVSWQEAVEFCQKLSAKTGTTVRLPTEAQWEYACRAGSKTRFGFGDEDEKLGDYAWYASNSESKTHPAGQKKPNAWGLYDMHGNVWEWCSDCFADSYAGAKTEDPPGPDSGGRRVLRGGAWNNIPEGCRSAYRYGSPPDYRDQFCGFRVAVDAK
jgi:formylglycine-generating enzyme required for sulfatase activity